MSTTSSPTTTDKLGRQGQGGGPTPFWKIPDKIARLRAAFSKNANVAEACHYAGISRSSYYEYRQKNPDTVQQWVNESLALRLKAKTVIADKIYEGSITDAWKFIEKVDPDYAPKAQHKFEAPEGESLDNFKVLMESLEKAYGDKANEPKNQNNGSRSTGVLPLSRPKVSSYQSIH